MVPLVYTVFETTNRAPHVGKRVTELASDIGANIAQKEPAYSTEIVSAPSLY